MRKICTLLTMACSIVLLSCNNPKENKTNEGQNNEPDLKKEIIKSDSIINEINKINEEIDSISSEVESLLKNI
ncbi:MAG: hypothetical protein JW717_01330 [Marinilabiliaceae bacterium]|nr:hypothetical protein [Marinilabiliaceae bacterium]